MCCVKKIQDAGLSQISVTNSAINNLPPDVDLVITHRDLTERAMRQVPQAQHISLTNFLDSGLYTSLTERLVAAQRHTENEVKVKDSLKDSFDDSSANLFKLGARTSSSVAKRPPKRSDSFCWRAASERRLR